MIQKRRCLSWYFNSWNFLLVFQISYASSSYTLSNKWVYPSFLRTVPTNQDIIQTMIHLIQRFRWNWVAFVSSKDEYSRNGLELFRQNIKSTDICLAFFYELTSQTNYAEVLNKIDSLSINVIIVFTLENFASDFVKTAVNINMRGKVWIAGDTWSMDQELSNLPGIGQIGTIFGVTETTLSIPGFDDFVYQSRNGNDNPDCANCKNKTKCNQVCEQCRAINAKDIINEDPTYSFSIQSAVYTYANALHQVLNCSKQGCNPTKNIPPHIVSPFKIVKSNELQFKTVC